MRETLSERIEAARRELAALRPGDWEASVREESPEGGVVVEYRSGADRVVGKLRADRAHGRDAPGSGEAAFRLLASLAERETRTFRVPRPILWCAGPRALLTEAAAGEPCRGLDPARAADTLERIGRALRELHELPAPPGPPRRLADHVAELIRPSPEALASALPAHAGRISGTLERLRTAEAAWGELRVATLHRDFHLRQLFDDGRRITVVDWDDAASGDPAFDVGFFTAYLRTHFDARVAQAGISAFCAGYGAGGGIRERVAVYEQFNYLRRACRRFRLRDAGWEVEMTAMLARLDQGRA